jgi:putative pyruvate formate lyase activating enzyme
VDAEELARIMLGLEGYGCHNINLVTPTHVVPQILEAIVIAAGEGLSLPLVYNTGTYDCVETLELLDGVVDIYMPDFKFWEKRWGLRFCQAGDYRDRAAEAIREMHRQVGDLATDGEGIAVRGLIVRHLVMPGGIAGSAHVMEFLAEEISPDTYVNIMGQYRPCGTARADSVADRRPTGAEIEEARAAAIAAGLTRLD